MKTVKVINHHPNSGCSACGSNQLSWKSLISAFLLAFVFTGLIIAYFRVPVSAQEPEQACVTRQEVETALDNDRCLVIQNGKVYDLTEGANKWDLDGHVGQHPCGKEFTNADTEAGPHDASVVDQFYLADLCPENETITNTQPETDSTTTYRQPFTIFGMTIRFFFAYVSLFAFLLNFLTCFAMPWAKWRAPWSGEKPGPDQQDTIGHFPLTHYHAYFAWFAIFSLAVHGFLGFACSWWGFCY